MNCNEYGELYLLSIDSKLEPSQQEALDGHRASCKQCQELQKTLSLLDEDTRRNLKEMPSAFILHAIRKKAFEQLTKSDTRIPRFCLRVATGLALAAVGMVAIAFFGSLGYSVFRRPSPAGRSAVVISAPTAITSTDPAILQSYFYDEQVAKVKRAAKGAFLSAEEHARLFESVSKKYEVASFAASQTLGESLRNLEQYTKKLNDASLWTERTAR